MECTNMTWKEAMKSILHSYVLLVDSSFVIAMYFEEMVVWMEKFVWRQHDLRKLQDYMIMS